MEATAQLSPPKAVGQRIASLDGLRAISIVMVILGHASTTKGFPHIPLAGSYSSFGVRVFFVISGFLITTLLIKERDRSGTISLREFYRRRSYRILPPAYLYILVIVAFQWKTLDAKGILCAAAYTINYLRVRPWNLGHLWTLSVEEQFYFLWPCLLLFFWRKRVQILIAAILLAPLVRILYGAAGAADLGSMSFPAVQDAMAVGCLLAIRRDWINTKLVDRWILPIAILTLTMMLFHYPHGIEPLIIISLCNFGIAVLIDHCIRKRYWLLNWAPIVWIGTISYSLYLWQQPFMNRAMPYLWTTFPLNVLLPIACASVSYYCIERPALRLRDRRAAGSYLR